MNFFTSIVCCGRRGKNADNFSNQHTLLEMTLQEQRRVLTYFADFEKDFLPESFRKLKAEDFLREATIIASFDGSLSTRQLSMIYQKLGFDFTNVITLYSQEYFFKSQSIGQTSQYDSEKVLISNILFCAGPVETKLACLYEVIVTGAQYFNQQKGGGSIKELKPMDDNLIRTLECLIIIPTLLMANLVEKSSKLNFKVPEERELLGQIEKIQSLLIDSTSGQLRDFAGMISREFFFSSDLKLLTKQQFIETSKNKRFNLVSPQEVRERFIQMLESSESLSKHAINFSSSKQRDRSEGDGEEYESDDTEALFKQIQQPQFLRDKLVSSGKDSDLLFGENVANKSKKSKKKGAKQQSQGVEPTFTFSSVSLEKKGKLRPSHRLNNATERLSQIQKMSEEDILKTLNAKYGEGFIKIFRQFQIESTAESQAKVNRNKEYLNSIPKLTFDLDQFPNPEVRQLLEQLKIQVGIQDLKDFSFGSYFDEGICDVYFRMLKLFNSICIDVNRLTGKTKIRNSVSSNFIISNTSAFGFQQPKDLVFMKVNQIMSALDTPALKEAEISGFFEKHGVIAPVVLNQNQRKQAVLVHINPLTLTAELYYRPNPLLDNNDISENVLSLLDHASSANEVHFEDDDVQGKVHEVDADTEEDMLVYLCYIAECLAFKKPIDIENKGIKHLRHRILDAIISLTYI